MMSHLEHWLKEAVFCVTMTGSQGELAIVPVDRNGKHPRHDHKRAIATPIDVDKLEQCAKTILKLVEAVRTEEPISIIIAPNGQQVETPNTAALQISKTVDSRL
jgi:hypothetical protein